MFSNCGRSVLQLVLVLAVVNSVVCQEEESILGPPKTKTTKNEKEDEDQTSSVPKENPIDSKEFLEKLQEALRLVPAPDLTKEYKKKGETTDDFESEESDVNAYYEKLVNERNLLKKMVRELGVIQYHVMDEDLDGDKETSTEDEKEELQVLEEQITPPKEEKKLTPEEFETHSMYNTGMSILNKTKGDKTYAYQLLQKASIRGHRDAQAAVAWGLMFGNVLEQDIVFAKEMFQTLADDGHPSGHMGLGFIYASGISENVSQSRALVHYTMAALGGDTWAQMAIAYRYWSGVTVTSQCEKALDFYRKVANKVGQSVSLSGGAAVQRVRLLDELENGYSSGVVDNDLIEYYQLLADKGDIQAQVALGQLHYQGGRGVDLDYLKALHYFTQAANAGNGIAMAYLGKIYLDGSDEIKQDNETALKYFKKASELGNPVGQSGLGLMYLYGRGVEKDHAKALKYFNLAADQGWVDGQLQLGNMYFNGIGVKRDYQAANKFFSLASQSGHVLAFYHLGQMHAAGMGMMRSCPTAVEFFKNVAERGRWSELLMQAHKAYRDGAYNEAFVQYALLAEVGFEVAQSNAAFMLDRNEVPMISQEESLLRALMYWGRAAAQGYSPAQVKLGDYHYYGLGTPVDFEAAASHYRLASDQQHNPQAMFNLGYMHEQGLGMTQDMHLAKRCYDLAAETSIEARVPVALALMKLQLMFGLQMLHDSPMAILFEFNETLGSDWDIYLITILTAMLGMIVYYRRPQIPAQPPM